MASQTCGDRAKDVRQIPNMVCAIARDCALGKEQVKIPANSSVPSRGNLMAITGPEVSGKSNFLGALLAGTLNLRDTYVDTLGTQITPNHRGHAVLYYDTEQSDEQGPAGSNHIFYRTDYQLLNHSLQSWSPVWTPHFPRDENIPIMQAFAGICKLVIFLRFESRSH